MATVLLVDDHRNVLRSMALVLEPDGHVVLEASSLSQGLALITARELDVLVTDVRLGNGDGTALLRAAKARDVEIEVVLVTAFGTIEDAVDAIKAGAYDYLSKPLDPDRLLITVRRAAERRSLAREIRQLRAQTGADRIVAESAQMQNVLKTVTQLAASDSTVLVVGETGTGKELIARALHEQSPRRGGKFVAINCGAFSETLLESELFGHRKGAFTGAMSDKKGLLEEADGGVLFLDEIGEMPLSMQVRLLRFLQGGEIRRIGDLATRRADVRLVAATHRSLEHEVAAGRFRQDFYYRINVVGLTIPPLRDRRDDIAPLAYDFLRRYAAKLRRPVHGFAGGAMALLTGYHWPGNVRELQNTVERAINLASGETITEADLPAAVTVAGSPAAVRLGTAQDERDALLTTLETCRWNQGKTAEKLGISRTTLWRKLREHHIET